MRCFLVVEYAAAGGLMPLAVKPIGASSGGEGSIFPTRGAAETCAAYWGAGGAEVRVCEVEL